MKCKQACQQATQPCSLPGGVKTEVGFGSAEVRESSYTLCYVLSDTSRLVIHNPVPMALQEDSCDSLSCEAWYACGHYLLMIIYSKLFFLNVAASKSVRLQMDTITKPGALTPSAHGTLVWPGFWSLWMRRGCC